MDFVDLADRYGALIALALWLIYKGWSFITERYFPQRVKEREDGARAVREAEATLLKARIDGEEKDREWKRRIEERTVSAMESISQNMAALVLSHTQHVNFSFGAHVELKDQLADLQELIIYKSGLQEKVADIEKRLEDTQEKLKRGGSGKG